MLRAGKGMFRDVGEILSKSLLLGQLSEGQASKGDGYAMGDKFCLDQDHCIYTETD